MMAGVPQKLTQNRDSIDTSKNDKNNMGAQFAV